MAKAKLDECLLFAINYIYDQHGIDRIEKVNPQYLLVLDILEENLVIEKMDVPRFIPLEEYARATPSGLFIVDCCILRFNDCGNIEAHKNNHSVIIHDGEVIDNGYISIVNKNDIEVKFLAEKSYKIVKKRLDNSQNNNYIRE